MTTNLIFKRTVTVDGVTKVVARVVPVNIPMINSGDGWTLSGHTDTIEVCEDTYVHRLAPIEPVRIDYAEQLSIDNNASDSCSSTTEECNKTKLNPDSVVKFESDVKGTAKLVRTKGVIRIVARRGKTVYNQTNRNSVCINDFTKNEFFKSCRELFGTSTSVFEFRPCNGAYYDYWNNIIDLEYTRQKKAYLEKNS